MAFNTRKGGKPPRESGTKVRSGNSLRGSAPARGRSSSRFEKPEKFERQDRKPAPTKASFTKPIREDKAEDENYYLVGRNAVLEAINHGKPIDKIFLRKDGVEGSLRLIAAKARERKIVVQEVDRAKLEMLADGANHQGVIALCPPQEYAEIEDILKLAEERGEPPFIIILDGVTDPHNLGAIIRTADASGAHGVIIPKRRAAGITPIVSKASAGAVAHVLVARVSNLVAAISDLKKRGVWVAAASSSGAKPMYTNDLTGALAIVVGSEGEGVSRLVKDNCDFGVSVPMHGKLDSLNASVAAGILMYEVVRQRSSRSRGTPE